MILLIASTYTIAMGMTWGRKNYLNLIQRRVVANNSNNADYDARP